ncbi:MAG: hypothetical protein K2Q34_07070 [Alphaproteobacteria bacterium]|nr:hypothetical protein [Alphaproteobacteria bacterium]
MRGHPENSLSNKTASRSPRRLMAPRDDEKIMTLSKGPKIMTFHSKSRRPFPKGHIAMSTERINHDPPSFQIGHLEPFSNLASLQANLPKTLTIKAKILPIKGTEKTTEIVMFRQGRSFEPCMLYQGKSDMAENGLYEGVQLVFESIIDGTLEADVLNTVLYEKRFVTQGNITHTIRQDLANKKVIVTPPGTENGQPIWGYGGYYRDSCSLDQIEQILFTPIIDGIKTGVFLIKASVWAKGASNPNAVMMEEASLSNLAGDIETGSVVLNVNVGVDENGDGHFQKYTSLAYKQNDPSTKFIEITFQKGENHAYRLPRV